MLDNLKEQTYLSNFVEEYLRSMDKDLSPDVRYVLDGYCETHLKAKNKLQEYEELLKAITVYCLEGATLSNEDRWLGGEYSGKYVTCKHILDMLKALPIDNSDINKLEIQEMTNDIRQTALSIDEENWGVLDWKIVELCDRIETKLKGL